MTNLFNLFVACYLEGYKAGLITGFLFGLLIGAATLAVIIYKGLE